VHVLVGNLIFQNIIADESWLMLGMLPGDPLAFKQSVGYPWTFISLVVRGNEVTERVTSFPESRPNHPRFCRRRDDFNFSIGKDPCALTAQISILQYNQTDDA